MRIVIISGSIPTTTFIDGLINGMAARGYSMIVIGKRTGASNYHKRVQMIEIPRSKFRQFGFVLSHVRSAGFKNLMSIYKSSRSLKLLLFELLFYLPIIKAKPDKIHIQWASTLHTKELLFTLFPGKILVSLRGSHINYTPIVNAEIAASYNQLFPKVLKFHAVSNAIAQEAIKYGADQNRIQTIYTSIENDVLQKKIARKRERTPLNIITVGRFHWIKGYNYLIDALKIVKERNVDFKLMLVAGMNVPIEILYGIYQNNLEDNICISDRLSHHLVMEMIEEADLMLLSSVNEGIANVVIEAMGLGTPVISSDCGGMKEVIENGVNGYLFENRKVVELADRVIEYDSMSVDERFRISLNAKRTVMEKFAKNRMLDEFELFYS